MDKFSKSEAIHFQKQTYFNKRILQNASVSVFFTQFFRAWKVPTFAAPTSPWCAVPIVLQIRPSFPCLRPSGTTKMAPKNCYWIGYDKILQMRRNEGTVKRTPNMNPFKQQWVWASPKSAISTSNTDAPTTQEILRFWWSSTIFLTRFNHTTSTCLQNIWMTKEPVSEITSITNRFDRHKNSTFWKCQSWGQECRPAKWNKHVLVELMTSGHDSMTGCRMWSGLGKSDHVFTQVANCWIETNMWHHLHSPHWYFATSNVHSATVPALAYLEDHLKLERQLVVLLELEDQVEVFVEPEDQVVMFAELEDQVVMFAELEDQVVMLVECFGWAGCVVSCPWQALAKACHTHHSPPYQAANGPHHERLGSHRLQRLPGCQWPCGGPKGKSRPRSKESGTLVSAEPVL